MVRTIWALLAATIAAPYLVAFFFFLFEAPFGDSREINEPLDFLKVLVIGSFGLGIFGLPTLLLAGVVAFILNLLGCHSRWHAIVSAAVLGGVLGCGFLALFFIESHEFIELDEDLWMFPLAGLLSGAICGWIYRMIAIAPCNHEGKPISREAQQVKTRHVVALFVASAAAPYLTLLFSFLQLLTSLGFTDISDAFKFVVAILVLGTAGLMIFGTPIMLTASTFGTILIAMGLYHRITTIIFGAALGGAFHLGLDAFSRSGWREGDFWPYFISMPLSGAICGWIYWRIATGGRAKAPLA
jgi:hypothetical protein